MKIYILGFPASGKTTLAKKLAQEQRLPLLELDTLFVKNDPVTKERARFYLEECWQEIKQFAAQPDWVIEGMYPIEELCQTADQIIWLRPTLLTSLYRQWKRYAFDPKQRQDNTFQSNLKLSRFLWRLYTGRKGIKVYRNADPLKMNDIEKMLQPLGSKVMRGM